MKNFNKVIWGISIGICSLFLTPNIVNASATTDEMLSKVSSDGKTAVLKMVKPKNSMEGYFGINGYFNQYMAREGYEISASCDEPSYTNCTINIRTEDLELGSDEETGKEIILKGDKADYTLTVTYDEPTQNLNTINNYISKLKDASMDPKSWYSLEDLSLVNYYLTSSKSELWNPGAIGRAAKYVPELNKITEGTNISYFFEAGLGNQDENLMYESAFGPMTIFYNGYSYGIKEEGIYLKRVLYIPNSTEDTKEAYVAAANKRLSEYLGNETDAVVTYGGLLSSLPASSEDEECPVDSDGNYYNITINKRTYKFYIIKADSSKLVQPVYNGKDISTNISVSSKDSSIPLDTTISVTSIDNKTIKDKIGTENYVTYNIELYSTAKESKIEKLENGLFEVSIPIPTELEGKSLIVYYEKPDGKLDEHDVTPNDGYAKFTTNHFSEYTLAEKIENKTIDTTPTDDKKETIENPQTYDDITLWITSLTLSLIGISGTVIYRKKHNM